MNAAAYLRVSSDQQDVATQRHAVERAAAARGDTIAAVYSEKVSGGTMARPELRRLRADVAAGRVGRLYVYALDRLTRTGILDTFALVAELRQGGAELVTVADPFDLAGPAAEVIVAVMAWAAQQERRRLNERLAAARVRVEAAGGRWGRPARLDAGQLIEVAARVRAGEAVRAIAVAMKVPRSTVGRVAAQVNASDQTSAPSQKPPAERRPASRRKGASEPPPSS
ncbi:MAG: recombinase family protein [Anaeromyxobacter sp.]|nr:recombinase family protein [Anaeromyxobacter sp.]MBL0276007.1 recombinase family protein [Anaeromyxobacter sp.]